MPRGKKLTWDKVEEIRKKYLNGVSTTVLAEEYGVDVSSIRSVVAHRTWKGKKLSSLKGRKTGRAPANKGKVVNEEAWAQKVQKAKKNSSRKGELSIDTYNACYAAYQEKQSAAYVAKKVGVHERTAAKYIKSGDATRNLRPLRDRLQKALERAQDREDYDLAQCRTETQKIARALLLKAGKAIRDLDPSTIKTFLLPRIVKDMQGVLERTLGVADATVKVEGEDRFARWSLDELVSFAKTGTFPTHDMMAQNAKK